ncbi:DUF6286 domain-containing protein [Nonomuraea sp. MCN248]|uniref:DUF6286 domain-containing protein n=1 Tax=Nonomuraea corallina TaxID=2989783 RepID=A0ABT4SI60_9ACTN|nr:DUF6286 domain-containing protein [Nonomuraea corallina]MDA0636908.1 DUF6286 domain-containing protein [Nonomuraea corallina]
MTTLQQLLPGTAVAPRDSPLRRSRRVLRPARTPAAVIVAALLTAGFGLVAAEIVAGLWSRSLGVVPVDDAVALASATSWHELSPSALGVALAGAGLILLAVLPGRCRLVPVETTDPLIVIGVTRSGLRRTLLAVARQAEGVERVRVRLRRRRIEVTVMTGPESSGAMLRQVGTAVGDRLAGLGTLGTGEVVMRLRRKGL